MPQPLLLDVPRRMPSADDALDLMVALGDDLRSLELPGMSLDRPTPPQVEALVAWSEEARAQVDVVLAEIDDARLLGKDVRRATRRGVGMVRAWVRRSLATWSTERGIGLLGSYLRQGEQARWDTLASATVAQVEHEPEAVDRFLGLYIEMAREAAEVGLASLIAPAGSR